MTTLTTPALNAACDAVTTLLDGGSLELVTSADAVLASMTFGTPAFGAAAAGVATANTLTTDDTITSGTVAKALAKDSLGATVFEMTVSTNGGAGDLQISSLDLVAGDAVSIGSFTFTQPSA